MATPKSLALLALTMAVASCSAPTVATLPEANDANGRPYLAPQCIANIEAVRNVTASIVMVSRSVIPGLNGRTTIMNKGLPVIVMRDDLRPWFRDLVLDHEKCHVWLYQTTGCMEFHR